MLISRITTHVPDAIDRLLQQYKGRPRFEAFITALVDQIQYLEDAIYESDHIRQLFDGTTYPAVGVQLDGVGEIVGVQRNGMTDAVYLLVILGTIAEHYSHSTRSDVLSIANIFFKDADLFLLFELFPAEIMVEIAPGTTDPALYVPIVEFIQKSLGVGVSFSSLVTIDPNNAFRFSSLTGNSAKVNFSAVPSTGAFNLYFGINKTGSMAYGVSAATFQAAVRALNGLSTVVITGDMTTGFVVNWADGAVVPISVFANTLGVDINIVDSVVISPGTGAGFSDDLVPGLGGIFASDIYTNGEWFIDDFTIPDYLLTEYGEPMETQGLEGLLL